MREAFLLPLPLCLLLLAVVPTTGQCRKPSGGLIYPPLASLAGSHRKGCPQGPLRPVRTASGLGVCAVESPSGARGQGARRTEIGRAGSRVCGWRGLETFIQEPSVHLSICPRFTHPSPTQRRPDSPDRRTQAKPRGLHPRVVCVMCVGSWEQKGTHTA